MKTLAQICGTEIAVQIQENDPNLVRLELIGGRGTQGIDDEDLAVLVKALLQNSHVIDLDLSENIITADGIRHLVKLKNIKKLNLVANNIGDEGANLLADMTQLTDLDISGNSITNIDRLLRALSNLEFLYAGGNNFSRVDKTLIISKCLQVLYLDENLMTQALSEQSKSAVYVPLFSILAGASVSSPPKISEDIKQKVDSLRVMTSQMGTTDKLYLTAMIIQDLGLSEIVTKKMSLK